MLVSRRVYVKHSFYQGDRSYAVLGQRVQTRTRARNESFSILERVLRAEPPKSVGDELRCAVSTISHHCAIALLEIGAERSPARVSILVVMAVHGAFGHSLPRACVRPVGRSTDLLLSAATPGAPFRRRLSASEWEVARLIIEGRSYSEVAASRGTSMRTTANQIAAAYEKLRISGRAELRARAAQAEPMNASDAGFLTSARTDRVVRLQSA